MKSHEGDKVRGKVNRQTRIKVLIGLILISTVWLLVLLKVGVWRATLRPSDGLLPHTFDGWAKYPVTRHYYLGRFHLEEFDQGQVYCSDTYPFLITNFLIVAPVHVLGGLPYGFAANFVPYFYMLCLTILLFAVTKDYLTEILASNRPFLWGLAFAAIGITVTDPLPWLCSLRYATDNYHLLAAAPFCYLSIYAFRGTSPSKPLLISGVFLALWSPIYVPAWILASLFFNNSLIPGRKWIFQVGGVSGFAALSMALPVLVARWAGLANVGSSYFFRSGLDGSTQYMTSISQAIYAPSYPRHWPTIFYPLIVVSLGLCFQYLFRRQTSYHPLRQAFFLLIPYLTIAILLPQFTSIHPYTTDQLLVIPATFLISFWFLQKEFWERLTGPTFVAFLLVAGLVLMTNLLAVAQNM